MKQEAKLLGNIYGDQFSTGFAGNVWDTESNSPTLQTMSGGNRQPLIYAEDKGNYLQLSGEGVYEKENRFYKSDAVSPTVNTCGGGNRQPKIVEPTVIGGVGEKKSNGGTQYYLQDRIYKGDVSTTTTTTSESFMPYNAVEEQGKLRIRKLTPRECFRLMGVKDDAFDRVQEHASDSTLYHLAGDSIVTTCLMAIFGKLLGVEWQEKVREVLPE